MIASTCLAIALVAQGVLAGPGSAVPPLRTEAGLKLTREDADATGARLSPRDTQYLAEDTTFHVSRRGSRSVV